MFSQVLATEFVKLRHSKVPWITLGVLAMAPLGIALFMWIVREPGRAAQLGLLGAKADISGLEATWPVYSSTITAVIGMGGTLLLSFIVAYVFGREYAEGTAKNMLALPVERHWFVFAKLIVSAAWWFAIAAIVIAESVFVGLALHLPGLSASLVMGGVLNALVAAGISYLLVPAIAWITIASGGYMAALGFALVMLALGNLFGHTGWSVWFPWSIVPSLIGMIGKPAESLPAGSYVVLALTFGVFSIAAVLQLRLADNTQ